MTEQGPINHDGELHCPKNSCSYWVPDGMEYLYADHKAEHESWLPMRYFEAKKVVGWQITRLKLRWSQ